MDVDRQLQLLTANAVDVIAEAELRNKIERGKPLRVKFGIDPTASDLHLGHAVPIRRLRMFQDCGHTAVLIIGDFTAMLGDPSGKSATRPQLSKDEVDEYAQTYLAQVVLTTPLLVGLDGEQKMSKSLGNSVGIDEPPKEQFGKIMSVPDPLIPMYFAHATAWEPEQIDAATNDLASAALHPNAAKRLVARTVVDLYHGAGAGDAAEAEFNSIFRDKSEPADMADFDLASGTLWADALVTTGLADSKRAARRSLEEGAVRGDGEVVHGDGVVPDGTHVLQFGRRKWARVHVG